MDPDHVQKLWDSFTPEQRLEYIEMVVSELRPEMKRSLARATWVNIPRNIQEKLHIELDVTSAC